MRFGDAVDDDDREAPIVLLTAGAPGVRCDVDGTAATGGAGGFGGMYGCCELVELGCGATGTTRRTLMKPIRSETPFACRSGRGCVCVDAPPCLDLRRSS